MQSPEYPQYRWVEPAAWSRGRAPGMPHLIVIHTTEGSEGPTSAEDGAAYDARRTDGTSTHFFVDSDSVVQCVRTTDRANAARAEGNKRGIHIEVCGRAGQTAAQWDDPVSRATVQQVAGLCRVLLADYPFPLVNLTPAQVRAGAKGFCEHKDISLAFGESDHTDPGPNFPWSRLFELIREDDVSKTDVIDALDDPVPWQSAGVATQAKAAGWGERVSTRALLEYMFAASVLSLPGRLAELLAAINADSGNTIALAPEQVGELAGLLSAALPQPPSVAEIADAVADEQAARLTS